MIKLIAFLGNPGREYENTRHNLAWIMADVLSFFDHLAWQKKFKGNFAQHTAGGEKIGILKPETFMNKSGESVQAAMQFFKLGPEELLVVHDDLELEFGEISIRKGGGLGGHNGLRSIAQMTGTPDFYRFRMGISRPAHGSVSSHVLGKFTGEQEIVLSLFTDRAAGILEECMKTDIEQMTKKHNRSILIPEV